MYNPNSSGLGKKRRSYRSFPFKFDEFYYYCEQYIAQYGHLSVPARCVVIAGENGPVFLRNANPEQNAAKIYDFGAKIDYVRRSVAKDNECATRTSKIRLTQDQCLAMDRLFPSWRSNGEVEFEEFYQYAVLFKERFGNLNVPLRCLVVKNSNGELVFKNYKNITQKEKENIVYYLGTKFARIVEFSNEDDHSSRRKFYPKEQFDRLAALDPCWNYPKNMIGNRIDPITGKNIDAKKVDENAAVSQKKRINTFDFEQFYSYALLYWTKFGNLDIHKQTVVVKLDDSVDFMRYDLALQEGISIAYHLGRYFTEIRHTKLNDDHHPDVKLKQVRRLQPQEYQKLFELDNNWCVEHKRQAASTSGIQHKSEKKSVKAPKKSLKKQVSPSVDISPKIAPIESREMVEETPREVKEIVEETPREVKRFDFDIFYAQCEYQHRVTGSLLFSNAKVVSIEYNGKKLDYPIGKVWKQVVATKRYELYGDKDTSIEKPRHLIRLDEEQNKKMEDLDPLWYLSRSEKVALRHKNRSNTKTREKEAGYGDN